ncbi:MAG: sigma-70 family RNA polymerase sigma factor [Acidobacteriota bacterium]
MRIQRVGSPGGCLRPPDPPCYGRYMIDGQAHSNGEPAGLPADDSGALVAVDLAPLVYSQLRTLARGFLSRERRDHTLQPTALVHEAYVRLARHSRVQWRGRTHFFAVGAQVMRRLLIDHARKYRSPRHGGDWQRVTLDGSLNPKTERSYGFDELLALNAALDRLMDLDPRGAKVVELRFFGGLKMAEIAEVLGVSLRTIEDDWSHARAWLAAEMAAG